MPPENKKSKGVSKFVEKKDVTDIPETTTKRPGYDFPDTSDES